MQLTFVLLSRLQHACHSTGALPRASRSLGNDTSGLLFRPIECAGGGRAAAESALLPERSNQTGVRSFIKELKLHVEQMMAHLG